ncbi:MULTISPECIES: GTP-binding protein [Catenuloplanes]|uniref:G3E family GTPase n=1 Tax=Catenuloplanes niger TaxID=587534 RepID=A0AAE4CYN8_9ACTN|nr:GTP-binding protein [Catenuloplanes niger]MDR7327793.1 G3E family GTPase [Catenuloplanes niger]
MAVPKRRTAHADTRHRHARATLTVVCGFRPDATLAVARAVPAGAAGALLVSHDLSGIRDGVLRRRVTTATAVLEDEPVTLVHGCVFCTLREELLPLLERLARTHDGRDLVLVLPEAIEPRMFAEAYAHHHAAHRHLRIGAYVTVADAAHLLDDLDGTDDLTDRGLHAADDDRRSVAEVVCHQLEYADTVVLHGEAPGGGLETARLQILLHRLVPWATHLHVPAGPATFPSTSTSTSTARHEPGIPDPLIRSLEGYPVGVDEPMPDCGVVSLLFRARRPFHPARLHALLETVTRETVRARGVCWIASQPDTVLAWESAGCAVSLHALGHWLDALPPAHLAHAGDRRRLAADLDWDPYYGDRHTRLAFVGIDTDAADLHRDLTACLLTDPELAEGADGWRGWDDPFAGCFPLPALTPASLT